MTMLVNSLLRLFEISIATSFLILPLCLASRRINRRYGPKWKYYIWLLLAVRLMIPVNLPAVNGFSILPDWSQPQQVQTQEQPVQPQTDTGSQPKTVLSQSQEQKQEQPISEPPYSIDGTEEVMDDQPTAIMNVADIAAIVWCVGFCVFSVFQLYVYYAFRRGIFVDGRKCENNSIHELAVFTNHAIKLAGLDPFSKKHVGKYSLGMRQRLGIAQAIMENPDLLILDEPFNALDISGVEEMRQLLLKLKGQGKTILIASHSKEDVDFLCDTVIRMDKGRIIER